MANRLRLESEGCYAGEGNNFGSLAGLRITNQFDHLQRRANLALINAQGMVLASTEYGHDTASRLKSVAKSGNTAAYSHIANLPLLWPVYFTNGTALRITTTKSYDKLNRLLAISSPVRFEYSSQF